MDRPDYVLHLTRTKIIIGDRELLLHLIMDIAGDPDLAGPPADQDKPEIRCESQETASMPRIQFREDNAKRDVEGREKIEGPVDSPKPIEEGAQPASDV